MCRTRDHFRPVYGLIRLTIQNAVELLVYAMSEWTFQLIDVGHIDSIHIFLLHMIYLIFILFYCIYSLSFRKPSEIIEHLSHADRLTKYLEITWY